LAVVLSQGMPGPHQIAQDHAAPCASWETMFSLVTTCVKRAMSAQGCGSVGGDLRDKTIALLGLTFNAEHDDMRDAPSIALVTAPAGPSARRCAAMIVGMEPGQARSCRTSRAARDRYACAEGADAWRIVTGMGAIPGRSISAASRA